MFHVTHPHFEFLKRKGEHIQKKTTGVGAIASVHAMFTDNYADFGLTINATDN